jgi:hypothetical protein
MTAEIVVAWPHLLDGRIRLQLVLDAIITGSQDGVTEARILTYDFRTAGLVSSKEVAGNSSELLGCRGDSPRIKHYHPSRLAYSSGDGSPPPPHMRIERSPTVSRWRNKTADGRSKPRRDGGKE